MSPSSLEWAPTGASYLQSGPVGSQASSYSVLWSACFCPFLLAGYLRAPPPMFLPGSVGNFSVADSDKIKCLRRRSISDSTGVPLLMILRFGKAGSCGGPSEAEPPPPPRPPSWLLSSDGGRVLSHPDLLGRLAAGTDQLLLSAPPLAVPLLICGRDSGWPGAGRRPQDLKGARVLRAQA